jgi:hypothetical protein
MDNHSNAEYDNFLEDLQSEVAQRVEMLRARQSAMTPNAFLDNEKIVRDWPDLAGRIMEDVR